MNTISASCSKLNRLNTSAKLCLYAVSSFQLRTAMPMRFLPLSIGAQLYLDKILAPILGLALCIANTASAVTSTS